METAIPLEMIRINEMFLFSNGLGVSYFLGYKVINLSSVSKMPFGQVFELTQVDYFFDSFKFKFTKEPLFLIH